jgi:uncharacterized protein YfbU (UPF0304 family)
MHLTLSPFERLTLVNQYRILAAVSASDREHYTRLADNLEAGHTWLYRDFPHLQEELSEATSEHVLDILQLYELLQASYRDLADKEGLTERDVAFEGFDGNNECEMLTFAQALIEDGRYVHVLGEKAQNSHSRTTEVYGRMLSCWRAMGEPHDLLSADQIRQILAERIHPVHR